MEEQNELGGLTHDNVQGGQSILFTGNFGGIFVAYIWRRRSICDSTAERGDTKAAGRAGRRKSARLNRYVFVLAK